MQKVGGETEIFFLMCHQDVMKDILIQWSTIFEYVGSVGPRLHDVIIIVIIYCFTNLSVNFYSQFGHWKNSNLVIKMEQLRLRDKQSWFIPLIYLTLICLVETSEMEVCVRILDESTDAVCAGMLRVEDAQQATCINGTIILDGELRGDLIRRQTTDQPRWVNAFFRLCLQHT